MDLHSLSHVIEHGVMVTVFVISMMILIEFLNIQTTGRWARGLQKKRYSQIFLSALLGLIPGCLGAFTLVSLYTHKLVGFAALITCLIASFGDEAFLLLSKSPEHALYLSASCLCFALIVGFIWSFLGSKTIPESCHFEIHERDHASPTYTWKLFAKRLQKASRVRLFFIASTLLFAVLVATKVLGAHSADWNWERITYLLCALFILGISLLSSDHFLEHHLWKHVVKKHALKIFLWTAVALGVIHLIPSTSILHSWVENEYLMLLLAVAIGLIPESGPNLIFITLFLEGTVPFSVLFANSIAQDGHGSLPLLAESKKDFIKVKLSKALLGLMAGYLGLTLF